MKKRSLPPLIIAALLAAGVFVLAACSPSGGGAANPQGGGGYFFTATAYGNTEIRIDDDMADVLKAIGEPIRYFEAASCAFNGLDKTYTYSGFTVTTRPDGDRDYVNSILLTDDSVKTPEGAYIGCAEKTAEDMYPGCEKTGNVISATKGGTTVNMIIGDGAVISIEYIPA